MHTLPPAMILLLRPFAPLFSPRVWGHVQMLLMGALLAPAQRTVAAALRVVGLGAAPHFQRYHRVLNRASWSALAVSRVLLRLLIATFVPDGPLVVGIDETVERRTGAKIAAKGVYRDAVRSSHSHFVKATGLRWVSLMLLTPIPWAQRVWALPFLTALAPCERYDVQQGRRHKALTDWAWQLLLVVRRWWPDRAIVAVADSGYAALRLLARCIAFPVPITVVTRLRLDAALYTPAPPRQPHQNGRPRKKGARLPTLAARAADATTNWTPLAVTHWYGERERTVEIVSETAVWYHTGLPAVPVRWVLIRDPAERFATQALLGTDRTAPPQQIIAWFVRRWQMERVPFGQLCGSAATSRRRDATTVDGVGDSPHDTRVARSLLTRDPARASAPTRAIRPDPTGSVVSQARPDRRRCVGAGPTGDLEARDFSHVR